jgi:GntR family transcriptional regulator
VRRGSSYVDHLTDKVINVIEVGGQRWSNGLASRELTMSHDFEPHYRRIIADIRARIAAGDLAPASKLPSTRELAHRYGVSPGSVRQAVTILIETGNLRGHQGLGVFVADLPEGP